DRDARSTRGGGQMTADGHFQVPQPTNEPVRSYSPSDPHRKTLKSRLAELTDARTEVPMQIGGERRWGASRGDIRAPHRHELAIAEYAVGGAKDIDDAISAALAARKMWAATQYHERAAVLLRGQPLQFHLDRGQPAHRADADGQHRRLQTRDPDSARESLPDGDPAGGGHAPRRDQHGQRQCFGDLEQGARSPGARGDSLH